MLVAAAYLVIRALMDDTIVDKDDVTKYLGLTTLAAIPLNQDESSGKRSRRKKVS